MFLFDVSTMFIAQPHIYDGQRYDGQRRRPVGLGGNPAAGGNTRMQRDSGPETINR
jgi:hypothetical protein